MSEQTNKSSDRQSLVKRGFELDRRVNHLLIAGGLGAAAVGAVLAVPAVAVGGAVVAGGSVAGLELTKRLESGYDTMRNQRIQRKLGGVASQSI